MIKYLPLLFLLFTKASVAQSFSSSCTATGNSAAIHKKDALRLAIKRVNDINSRWKDSIEIPSAYVDSIAKALYAIDNMDWSPLKDTIRTLFSYSNFSSNNNQFSHDSLHIIHAGDYNTYRLDSMSLTISASSEWYSAWQIGNYSNTPNDSINSLVKRYGLQITKYNSTYYYVSVPKPINIGALAKMFKSIKGVSETYFADYAGDGQYIKTEVDQGNVVLSFYHACGDCPSGCTFGRMWKFKIDPFNCYVTFINASNWGGTLGQILYGQAYTCMSQIMPVTFKTIKARLNDKKVSVTWEVATETDIKKYVIQRSTDGVSFIDIGEVEAVGNSSAAGSYIWVDKTPLINNNYYRIKLVGLGGETRYTEVVNVNRGSDGMFLSIYPNPAKGKRINLQFFQPTNEAYFLKLFTQTGQVVLRTRVTTTTNTFMRQVELPASLTPGKYFLDVSNSRENVVLTVVVE